MNHRKDRVPGTAGKAVESLLLNSEREAERVIHERSKFPLISRSHAVRMRVSRHELALRVVVFVVPFATRQQERPLNFPSRTGAEVEAPSRQEGLCDGIVRVLHLPRSQILSQHRCGQPAPELLLQSDVGRGIEIFLD